MSDRNWILTAKSNFINAQRELTWAVKALENSGGDFSNTISQIKESIGDLHVAILSIDDYEEKSSSRKYRDMIKAGYRPNGKQQA